MTEKDPNDAEDKIEDPKFNDVTWELNQSNKVQLNKGFGHVLEFPADIDFAFSSDPERPLLPVEVPLWPNCYDFNPSGSDSLAHLWTRDRICHLIYTTGSNASFEFDFWIVVGGTAYSMRIQWKGNFSYSTPKISRITFQ